VGLLLTGAPPAWRASAVEVDRWQGDDPAQLVPFLEEHGLAGEPAAQRGHTGVAVLLGARACARLAGVPPCRPGPAAVPEVVAIAYRPGEGPTGADPGPVGQAVVGPWSGSWTDAEHADAVRQVRASIAAGEVYQANVVGHRAARFRGDARVLAAAVAGLPGATYGGMLAGPGWLVASASPEQLVRVVGSRIATEPIKGTGEDERALRRSSKDRAEHVMIVDLERNDLARVTVPGSVEVEELYRTSPWSDLWHASSVVSGQLATGVTVADVLRAVVPGGSVTGAPKHAACGLLADLEPVGRGPSMGALGFVWPGGMDLGLTIRTVAFVDGQAHLWAGGGITWGSDPEGEVREAHAKAAPLLAAMAQVRPSSS
jgi:para-aminobenzoate synthetase component 1